jgi:hypothetical protein
MLLKNMSSIEYRHFEDEEDIGLQYAFWTEITRNLPYAWKPTRSPSQFYDSGSFDPRSRYFAFDGNILVGYMSFTGAGEFVSLGYPWVKSGYEHIRETLWDNVYEYAIGDHGGRFLAQRFREQWEQQIEWFLGRGFERQYSNPIYGLDLSEKHRSEVAGNLSYLTVRYPDVFDIGIFLDVVSKIKELSEEAIHNTRTYYETVQFDLVLSIDDHDSPVAYFGLPLREDTGFAEIVAQGLGLKDQSLFHFALDCIIEGLQGASASFLGIETESGSEIENWIQDYGFSRVSADVMLAKRID